MCTVRYPLSYEMWALMNLYYYRGEFVISFLFSFEYVCILLYYSKINLMHVFVVFVFTDFTSCTIYVVGPSEETKLK